MRCLPEMHALVTHVPQLSYLHCPVDDSPTEDISVHFDAALAFIAQAKTAARRVLVHCRMGMRCVATWLSRHFLTHTHHSRSATLVILWLMSSRGISLREVAPLPVCSAA